MKNFLMLAGICAASTCLAQDYSCLVPPGRAVSITGAVTHPGVYPLPLTLSSAIAMAGGLADPFVPQAVIIRLDLAGRGHEVRVSLNRMLGADGDVKLRPGDLVYIPDTPDHRLAGCLPELTH